LIVNGKEMKLPVTGFYETPEYTEYEGTSIKYLPAGVFVSKEKFNSLGIDKYVKEFWLNVKDENYKSFYNQASKLPNTFIESSFRMEEEMNLILDMMVRFSVSVASLALLAGVILIIIVTVLDVTSRGRDFAIYKTLGFVQKEVVWMVLLEYGVMTVITSAFASLMSFVACEVINRYDEELFGFTINQKLNFNFGRSMLLNVIIIGLVLLLVHLVSKKPLKVKPTEVLRYE
jgi:ABC-type lipoprotein release transport system permease subunit